MTQSDIARIIGICITIAAIILFPTLATQAPETAPITWALAIIAAFALGYQTADWNQARYITDHKKVIQVTTEHIAKDIAQKTRPQPPESAIVTRIYIHPDHIKNGQRQWNPRNNPIALALQELYPALSINVQDSVAFNTRGDKPRSHQLPASAYNWLAAFNDRRTVCPIDFDILTPSRWEDAPPRPSFYY